MALRATEAEARRIVRGVASGRPWGREARGRRKRSRGADNEQGLWSGISRDGRRRVIADGRISPHPTPGPTLAGGRNGPVCRYICGGIGITPRSSVLCIHCILLESKLQPILHLKPHELRSARCPETHRVLNFSHKSSAVPAPYSTFPPPFPAMPPLPSFPRAILQTGYVPASRLHMPFRLQALVVCMKSIPAICAARGSRFVGSRRLGVLYYWNGNNLRRSLCRVR